jgi:hypothetical protein
MATKYDYISTCCNTGYSEIRDETQPQVYSTCVQCGQGTYLPVAETVLPLPEAAPDSLGENSAIGLTDTPPIKMANGPTGISLA